MSIRPALSIRPSHILAIVLATFGIGFVANVGTAAAVPGPNQTVLTLDPVIVAALKTAKVKVVPVGAATIGSAGLYFPVINSNVNDLFVGTSKHQGGFELRVDIRHCISERLEKARPPIGSICVSLIRRNSTGSIFRATAISSIAFSRA